jgi:hypothetical protein
MHLRFVQAAEEGAIVNTSPFRPYGYWRMTWCAIFVAIRNYIRSER